MSDEAIVIRNQLGQFWARSGEWVDGREPQRLLKFKHRDEAVNQLVELSAKDIDLRGEVLACELDDRKEPIIDASEHLTPTLADVAALKTAEKAARKIADKEAEAALLRETPTGSENTPELTDRADAGLQEPASGATV